MPPLALPNRLQVLEAQIYADRNELARRLWNIGNALLEIRRDEVWRLNGSSSFSAWLSGFAVVARSTAFNAMLIAEQFSGDVAVRFGSDKLLATTRYLTATQQTEAPGDLATLKIRVRGADGTWETVPFADASATTINQATQLIAGTRAARNIPAEIRTRARRLSAVLPGAGKADRVTLSHGRGGKVLVTFKQVPLDEMPAFIAALQAHGWGGAAA